MPSRESPVEIQREDPPERGGVAALVVAGELDLAVAPELEAALDPGDWSDAAALVLDVSAVSFIDSSGIRVVATRLKQLSEEGVDVGLVVEPGGRVSRALEFSGLSELLPIESDRESAERRLS